DREMGPPHQSCRIGQRIVRRTGGRRTMPPRTMIAGAFACTLTMSALAQDYPSRSITMMISFSAGSSIDVAGRIVAARLAEILGPPVVIEHVRRTRRT